MPSNKQQDELDRARMFLGSADSPRDSEEYKNFQNSIQEEYSDSGEITLGTIKMPSDEHSCKGWSDYLFMNSSLSEKFEEDTSYLEKGRKPETIKHNSKKGTLKAKLGEKD